MTELRVARVLIDSPLPQLDRLFDYAIPESLVTQARPGVRVRVPLRSAGRIVDGYLVELAEANQIEPTPRPLSELDAIVSPVPVLTPALYALARRVADRAAGSAGDILRLAIPQRMVRAEKAWLAGAPVAPPSLPAETVTWSERIVSTFTGLGAALDDRERVVLDAPPRPARVDSETEVGAWAELLAAAALRELSVGRSAVLVVPDYRDQAQVEAVLAARGAAEAVVRVDARQSGPERYSAFLRTLSPAPCIVVGNRSAVYARAHALGLIAVWDDGDPLLSEPLSPGVHARDAALVRQELDHCALVFAGHTRTTDVERLVAVGWVRDIPATRRESPRVVLSATNDGEARSARLPSAAFASVRDALAHGPVLVQVSRPGYAPVLVCGDCRRPARCRHCAGPLRARRAGATPECGWCGRTATGWRCPHCESQRVRMASSGSERTADELGRAFPGVRVMVADGDHPITKVDERPALIVATRGAEPHAIGGYRAIILLDGDRMLLAEDLRIGESCLRWWSNAAALAAPGAPVHLVGVTGAVARALATWTQPAYARAELAGRSPLRMPPTVRVAAVEGVPRAVDAALAAVQSAPGGLGPTHGPDAIGGSVLGPVAVPADTGPALARALVRFDYSQGRAVVESLRASVIAEALRTRKPVKGRPQGPRNTLRVRVDVPDLDL